MLINKNHNPPSIFILFVILSVIFLSGCSNEVKKAEELKMKIKQQELLQKNKELELKQKELELKSNELNLLKKNIEDQNNLERTASELFEKYNQSVFKIYSLDNRNELLGTGTGFFIGNEGYAVTNAHVVKGASTAYIELIGSEVFYIDFDKMLLEFNEREDHVIFKLPKNDKFKGFNDYSDVPRKIGETIFTIGNPSGGSSNTISQGILTGYVGSDIQFSAPIDHGSSGSPLFNTQGKLLGLVWGGKHEGNLYRAKGIVNLDLSRFLKKNISYDDKLKDPNLAGPFMGEYSKDILIWSISTSLKEAVRNLNLTSPIQHSRAAVDGNGSCISIDKYHDKRYGLSSFIVFGLPTPSSIRLTIGGKTIESYDIKSYNVDRENELISMVFAFENSLFISILTKFDLQLYNEFGLFNTHPKRVWRNGRLEFRD